MKKNLYKMLVFILALIVLGSFTVTAAPPAQDDNVALTAVISTMVSSFFETQTAMAPSATSTLAPSLTPVFTATSILPTATFPPPPTIAINTVAPPILLATTGPVVVVTPNLASGCNNLAYIRDVTIPDGTVRKPQEGFTKTWKVQNTGTCPWSYQFIMVLVSGGEFDVNPRILRRIVEVNDWSEISLDMTAPKKEGKYSSYWRMSDGVNLFGDTLSVTIIVAK